MLFTGKPLAEASGKAQCRWVAVNHGTSENGNHHIHLAVSLVREDGTKASTHGDYKKAQQTCRELEVKYGLGQLSTVHATRGYDRAEKATDVKDEREMHRSSLARKVRASASASATEGEFARRARDTGMLLRPRFAKNTTDDILGPQQRPGQRVAEP
nr:relaxase/mobilization nuclease domain-containing protein [Pseudarthrobacter albicanus]